MHKHGPLAHLRGFTLIELIVVILILGILAAVAIIGYGAFTDRAQAAAAQANLRQVTTAVLASETNDPDGTFTRHQVIDALARPTLKIVDTAHVAPGNSGADSTTLLLDAVTAPAAVDKLGIGFDNGPGTAISEGPWTVSPQRWP